MIKGIQVVYEDAYVTRTFQFGIIYIIRTGKFGLHFI